MPDVLLDSLPSREAPWEVLSTSHTKMRLALGSAEVELRFAPVSLAVSVGGVAMLVWNQDGRFDFEHHREKQVQMWAKQT